MAPVRRGVWEPVLTVVAAMGMCSMATRIPAPGGAERWLVECRDGVAHCYTEAAERCPEGYQTLDGASGDARGEMLIECIDEQDD